MKKTGIRAVGRPTPITVLLCLVLPLFVLIGCSGSGSTTFSANEGGGGGSPGPSPNPGPGPTPTPAPSATLSASPTTVTSGGSSSLSWSSSNSNSCVASGAWSGSKATSGSQTLSNLTSSGTYTLTCSGGGGSTSRSVTISVTGSTAPTVSISASPALVDANANSTLTWSSTNATACTGSGAWSGSKSLSGSQQVGPISGTTSYTLTCTGTGGTTVRSAVVSIRGAATVYVEKYYESENSSDVEVRDLGRITYVVGGGYGGSNAWQLRPYGDRGNEINMGWIGTTSLIPVGAANSLFVGHLLYVSAGLVDKLTRYTTGGKMLDLRMHESAGDPSTRQIVVWRYYNVPDSGYADTGATGVVPMLIKGGAGGLFVRQIGPRQFDLRDYVNQWVWFEYEFNSTQGYTAMWIKTQDGVFTGAQNAPMMKREANNPAHWRDRYGWNEPPYDYTTLGWSGSYSIWGFWDDLSGVPFTDSDFVRLDNLIVSNSWINPPF